MQDQRIPLPFVARLLGYGGLIPFVFLAGAISLNTDLSAFAVVDKGRFLLAYAAVIISFIGAVHWGVALTSSLNSNRHYLYSVVPALVAWLLQLLPLQGALAGMALTIVAAYLVDRAILFEYLGSGYRTLRLHLTIVVAACLLLAMVFSGGS
jgi:hypothetical protein